MLEKDQSIIAGHDERISKSYRQTLLNLIDKNKAKKRREAYEAVT